MKKLFIALLLASCSSKEYKYRIEGTVETKDGPHAAVWYTDTICFDNDTIFYHNSDSTEVRIYPPYVLKHLSR